MTECVASEPPVGMTITALQNMQSELKSSQLGVTCDVIGNSPTGSLRKNKVMFDDIDIQQEPGDEYDKCFIKVVGMTCSSCVANVERHVMKMEGQCHCLPLM